MATLLAITAVLAILFGMVRTRWGGPIWIAIGGAATLALWAAGMLPTAIALTAGLALTAGAVLILVPRVRQTLVSRPLLAVIKQKLPPMSETERTAIEAGTVWWEAELFRGDPNFDRLLALPRPRLSAEEQAFLDGPTEALCRMLDDWHITHELNRLPDDVWEFVKREGFLGMIIPREYGGLGFSALAHSQVVMKLASRSVSAGVSVMVPNSLGPAELLMQYGTPEQQRHYLPRLARGLEIPCFALTGPDAGSDASAIPDFGVICRGTFEGKETLGLRLNWEKRYITLGPIATLLGLAFRVYDPDHLLGEEEDLGITCALIPVNTSGVEIGDRHYPLNAAFMNGPNRGRDVFIPIDWVIGGQAGVGHGWRMLMECLSAGRGISLPALSVAGAKHAARCTGAYARIRKQFRQPIGRFEGVEEALARMGGLAYLADAARTLTTTALDLGEKPSVVSAILKSNLTEMMRQAINDAMDVHGGRGICMGPSNYLARTYQSLPISITVEGANILTRSMIIFGQGALRCHPYLVREIEAAHQPDAHRALAEFDTALLAHLGYTVRNAARSLLYGLSGGLLAPAPAEVPLRNYYRQIARYSSAFALTADIALLVYGGNLKRREKISGRFADALSHLYFATAVLKRFEDQGRQQADLPFVTWSLRYCYQHIQDALDGIIRHFAIPPLRWAVRLLVFPLGRRARQPDDATGHRIAELLMEPGEVRTRLLEGIFHSRDPADITGRLEVALTLTLEAEPIENRLADARLRKRHDQRYEDWIGELAGEGQVTQQEACVLLEAHAAVRSAIMVDAFPAPASAVQPAQRDTRVQAA